MFFFFSQLRNTIVDDLAHAFESAFSMESIERSNAQLIEHMNVVYNIVVEYVSGIKGHVLIGRNLLWEYEGFPAIPPNKELFLALKKLRELHWRHPLNTQVRIENLLDLEKMS